MRIVGVALVTLTAVALGVTYTNHAPLIPLLAAEFALSDLEAGLLTTALFLSSVITFLVGGTLADRTGPRRILALGVGLALAGNIVFALAPSYGWLLIGKGISGLGSGLGFNAGVSYVAGLYGDDRSHFGLGLYGGGYPLGSAIAIFGMPPLAVLSDWRTAFWISSAAIALVLLLWPAAPETRQRRPTGWVLEAATCGNCWWASVQHGAGFGLSFAAGTWITVYLLREFALPLAFAGLLGSLLLAVTMLARPLGGLLLSKEHLGSRTVMRTAQLLILVGLLVLALPGRPLLAAVLGAVAVGLGGGLPYAAVFNTAAASLRSAPGAAQGFAAVGGTFGALGGAPAMGFAAQTWGFSAAWLIPAVMSTSALLGTFLMRGEEDLL